MDYPIEKRALGYILEDKARKNSDKTFFYYEDKEFTYSETNKFTDQVANGYLSLGVKKGDKVTAMLPNVPEFVFHWFGLAKLGGVDSPINTAYKGDLLKHVIVNSNTKVLFIFEDFLERIVPIQDELSCLEKIVVYAPSGKRTHAEIRFPMITFDELIDQSTDFSAPEEVSYYDPLQIIYTSGTTGPSKGVLLPHNAMYHYARDTIESLELRSDDIYFSCLPMFHINIRFFTIVPALLLDAKFAMIKRFSASRFWDDIRRYNATLFCLLGGMTTFLLKQPPSDKDRDNPARMCWGGPMPGSQAKELEARFNLKTYLGYFGMSEANWITCSNVKEMDALKAQDKWDQAMGMGKENNERYEVGIVDDYDNEVPVGQTGELICRPKRPFAMMLEYISMPDKTTEAFRNLWFHTGDIVKKDEEGFFYFVDRKKDYIRRRGENVSSYEVESSVNANPRIAESAAIGIKAPEGEEEIVIIVRLKEGESLDPQELYDFCEKRMAKFMIPKYMKIVDEIPKTATERIEKYKLRDSIDREKLTVVYK
ncbi:MAG: AMP-binding protein [Thermodesulfobacteriota bacterium]|nr:AMP-binding protein [Thermodesulfobacteriota bacterium]